MKASQGELAFSALVKRRTSPPASDRPASQIRFAPFGVVAKLNTIERSAEASGAAARAAGAAEAAGLRARAIRPLPPPGPVPDMLYVEVDGTGVPVRRSETEGRKGKADDGGARTREIKLARLFTVSALDDDGYPVMDPGSSSYVSTFDGKDAPAELVEAEYLRRGSEHFRQVVAIGDDPAWIWAMAGKLYPHATHITDLYHAREHLHDLANHLAFIIPDPARWLEERSAEPGAGNIQAIIQAASQYPLTGIKAGELATKLGYFEHNAHRMRYQHFRELGMFTGSGHIEAGCKPSSSSAPNSQACTGPPPEQPASSPCAASTPAADGTNSGPPAPPARTGSGRPSDRPSNSDPQAAATSKIISNKPDVHPCQHASSVPRSLSHRIGTMNCHDRYRQEAHRADESCSEKPGTPCVRKLAEGARVLAGVSDDLDAG